MIKATLAFPRNIGVHYCSNIYWNGTEGFEPLTWRVIKHFLARSKLFIDIGSNIGFYAVLAKKIAPNLAVKAYEPIPSIYVKNRSFHKTNGLSASDIINGAIGDEECNAEIFLPISEAGVDEETTATLREDSWQYRRKHQVFTVKTEILDAILEGKTPEDKVFIKIDVEDYEANVLRGAVNVLRNTKPAIVCEVLPRTHGNQDTIGVLQENGYVAFGISKEGLVRFNKDDFLGSRPFTDFLLLPDVSVCRLNYIGYENLDTIAW